MRTLHTSEKVSTLTLAARISESGTVTQLPERITPVGWAIHYENWQRAAEDETRRRADAGYADAIARGDLVEAEKHRAGNRDSWNRIQDQVVEEMRRTALEAIDATGPATLPTRWEESARIFLVQGEWTVTVSVSGTDHVAVREAYATQLGARKAAILADAQNRIPRIPGPLPRVNPNSPDKVRAAWRRDRRQGTAPKPASGAFAPGSWVTWAHPETGATLTGVVTGWLPDARPDHLGQARGILPADGSEPVVMSLGFKAKPSAGPWHVIYETGSGVPAVPFTPGA